MVCGRPQEPSDPPQTPQESSSWFGGRCLGFGGWGFGFPHIVQVVRFVFRFSFRFRFRFRFRFGIRFRFRLRFRFRFRGSVLVQN